MSTETPMICTVCKRRIFEGATQARDESGFRVHIRCVTPAPAPETEETKAVAMCPDCGWQSAYPSKRCKKVGVFHNRYAETAPVPDPAPKGEETGRRCAECGITETKTWAKLGLDSVCLIRSECEHRQLETESDALRAQVASLTADLAAAKKDLEQLRDEKDPEVALSVETYNELTRDQIDAAKARVFIPTLFDLAEEAQNMACVMAFFFGAAEAERDDARKRLANLKAFLTRADTPDEIAYAQAEDEKLIAPWRARAESAESRLAKVEGALKTAQEAIMRKIRVDAAADEGAGRPTHISFHLTSALAAIDAALAPSVAGDGEK